MQLSYENKEAYRIQFESLHAKFVDKVSQSVYRQ